MKKKKKMNNIITMKLLTSLVFTLIAIGLFEISSTPIVNNVFLEKDKEKKSNIEKNTATSSS